jgi:8-oxo-dGTP pyrophosphatase MutT (NUDIX family)
VEPRLAATVIVARDAAGGPGVTGEVGGESGGEGGGLEVLMLRRNLRSDFVGGAYVFPGGAVDPDDTRTAAAYAGGRSPEAADALLGVDGGGLAIWVAAVRECFEEVGLLLADPPAGASAWDEAGLAALRARLHRDELPFSELCAAHGIVPALDRIERWSHWITPEGSPRRYDTHFFVAAAPNGQRAVRDGEEAIGLRWITPAGALAAADRGEMEVIFPTRKNLERLLPFPDTASLLAHAAALPTVPAIQPRLVTVDGEVRPVLPDDAPA